MISSYVKAHEEGLQQLGWIRNRTIIIEEKYAGTMERMPAAVAELTKLNVKAIVTGPNRFIDVAKQVTQTVPIAMVYGTDPVGQQYVASPARPGGNITGLAWHAAPEIGGKYVELLTQLRPRPTRIAGIRDPWYGNDAYQKEAEIAAKTHAVTLTYVEVRSADDLPEAFASIASARNDAIIVFQGPTLWTIRSQISDLARKSGLPTMYIYRDGPDAGGLMSDGPNLRES